MDSHCGRAHSMNSAIVIPSGPGAPPLPRTRTHARSILERDTTASISISGNTPLTAEWRLRAGCSNDADPVRPGRDTESV